MRLNVRTLLPALPAILALLAAPGRAEILNSYHVILNVDGSNQINVTGGGRTSLRSRAPRRRSMP